jgi:hypothetical protein
VRRYAKHSDIRRMTRRPVTAGSQWRKKKSRLPNNFDRLLADEDLENLQAIFDTREVKTRGGPGRQATACLPRGARLIP